jgi:hypothetical protein
VAVGWTNDLLRGIAQHLENQGIGTYDPTGVPSGDPVWIVVGPMPASPDRVIGIADYTPNGQNQSSDVARQVQVRVRGARNDPGSMNDLRDAVEDALDGLTSVKYGQVAVQQIFLGPRAELGQDGNQRSEATSNFTVQARRSTPLRTE